MLRVDHNVRRVRSIFVDFRNAGLNSRKASIRDAIVCGMLLRYRGLPMDEIVRWMNEIGDVILDDYRVRRRSVAKKELEQLPVLYGILLGCSRSIAVDRDLSATISQR